ncbi:MAG: hypothetical protein EAZ95_00790 [Bacteroidetes bacterium]|nr:MAG: hypothetical protein EAZ95_00790 [Bacteroidota bacterium]
MKKCNLFYFFEKKRVFTCFLFLQILFLSKFFVSLTPLVIFMKKKKVIALSLFLLASNSLSWAYTTCGCSRGNTTYVWHTGDNQKCGQATGTANKTIKLEDGTKEYTVDVSEAIKFCG